MHGLAAALVLIKIATLAPEGSSWLKLFHKWQAAVEEKSQGKVKIKFFTGGMQGDEKDMLRKIKLGSISAAAITAIGMAQITPEVRVLEVCRNYQQLDHARSKLDKLLRRSFEARGYELYAWGDVGPVHLFSKKQIKSLEDMRGAKMWLFNDDQITRKGFETLGLHGTPLAIPEVLPALSTGMIDTYVGSPLSTVALQWNTQSKYVTSAVLGQATGALVFGKKAWDALAPDERQVLIDTAPEMEKEVTERIRADNATAWESLKKQGMIVTPISKEFERSILEQMSKIALDNMDMVLAEIDKAAGNSGASKEFQLAVRDLLEEYKNDYPGLPEVLEAYDKRHGGRPKKK